MTCLEMARHSSCRLLPSWARSAVAFFPPARVRALQDVDVGSAHAVQRPHFVLAILEIPLLVMRQGASEPLGDGAAQLARGVEGKQPEAWAGHTWVAISRNGMLFGHSYASPHARLNSFSSSLHGRVFSTSPFSSQPRRACPIP